MMPISTPPNGELDVDAGSKGPGLRANAEVEGLSHAIPGTPRAALPNCRRVQRITAPPSSCSSCSLWLLFVFFVPFVVAFRGYQPPRSRTKVSTSSSVGIEIEQP